MDKENFKSVFFKIVNKYTITIVVFLCILFMGEKHNAMQRIEYARQIKALEQEIEYYKELTRKNQEKLEQLQSDNANLEKFAREEWLMKEPDEDIFKISNY